MHDIDHADDPDDRAAAIRARAQEILDRQPTEAELAEDEARRERNREIESTRRIEAAVLQARQPPVREVQTAVSSSLPESSQRRDRDLSARREFEAELKGADRPWTDAERRKWWRLKRREVAWAIFDLVAANKVTDAIGVVMRELGNQVRAQRRREAQLVEATAESVGKHIRELDARMEALEAAVKPRVRVKARSEKSP